MIIVLKPESAESDIRMVEQKVIDFGYEPRILCGEKRTVIAAIGDETRNKSLETLEALPVVEQVLPIQKRYKLVSREFHRANSVVRVGSADVGAGNFMTIAGPCSVESREQLRKATEDVVAAGVSVIRGGAYKPRTSPYDFQGLGEEGLQLLQEMKEEFGVAVVTEVVGVPHVETVAAVADVLQIGARNCQNYHLLENVAGAGRPVLLKRGMSVRVSEWLSAAEYLVINGCENVILCERGIRTFEDSTRSTLDVSAVVVAKRETHLPVIVDPSHAAGYADLVVPLAKAGIAAGADGMIIETHPNPPEALSDSTQQIPSREFKDVMDQLRPLIDFCAAGNMNG